MRKIKMALFFVAAVFQLQMIFAQSGKLKPLVFSLDADVLLTNKYKIGAKDATLAPAYKVLLKDADKALAFGPVSVMEKTNLPPSGDKHDYMSLAPYFWPDPSKANGLPYMRKDGQTNPEVKDYKDKEYFPRLCDEVNTLSLAWYFSDDKRYAEHAAKLLKVWFLDTATRMNPNLKYAQAIKGQNEGRGAGLIDTRHLIKVIDAIGILNTSGKLSQADIDGLKKWFSDFLQWMQTSKNGMDEMNAGNNHGVWYDAQRLSFALFIGDKKLSEKIVLNVQSRLDKQMNDEGMFPAEMVRTISLHYTVFVLEPLFIIAQMAKPTGIDLWNYTSPSGKSLKKGFDALLPYLQQEKKWEGPQIKEFDFEEAVPLLATASSQFKCTACIPAIKKITADKATRLRIRLLTNIAL